MPLKNRPRCSAEKHIGCGAYRANLKILAEKFQTTPTQVEAVLKQSEVFQNFKGCWGYFTNAVLKKPKNLQLLAKKLKQT